jgi:predicted metal-dependent hydrolase
VIASALTLLQGYPPDVIEAVRRLIDQGRLAELLRQRHPEPHAVRSDPALYDYVNELRQRHLRHAPPLSRVCYDASLRRVHQALGTHTAVSRVQGGRLKAKREIRIASLFREAPADLLRMIVVHELAHLKEPDHDRAFYALCHHIEPDYARLEFDARLFLIQLQLEGKPT